LELGVFIGGCPLAFLKLNLATCNLSKLFERLDLGDNKNKSKGETSGNEDL
jgi:hypothetical protein